jgi:hypothetical protein
MELEKELEPGAISEPESREQQLRLANPGAMEEEAVQPLGAHIGGTMPEFREPFDGEQCTRT